MTDPPAPRRRLVIHPEEVLRRRADPIESFDESLRELAEDMALLMRLHRGAGIAAPQVGESVRVFLAAAENPDDPPTVFVNPRLHEFSAESAMATEGCLSLPEIEGQVMRPKGVAITAFDVEGREFTLHSEAFPARVWQHEVDHLDGVLIIDRMRMLDRLANRRAIRELEQAASEA